MVAVAEHIKVPELRFPDFSGDWEEKFGNEVFDRITDKNHKSDLYFEDSGAGSCFNSSCL